MLDSPSGILSARFDIFLLRNSHYQQHHCLTLPPSMLFIFPSKKILHPHLKTRINVIFPVLLVCQLLRGKFHVCSFIFLLRFRCEINMKAWTCCQENEAISVCFKSFFVSDLKQQQKSFLCSTSLAPFLPRFFFSSPKMINVRHT